MLSTLLQASSPTSVGFFFPGNDATKFEIFWLVRWAMQ
jgi:hypothetical protein